jgi:hypothetical protein
MLDALKRIANNAKKLNENKILREVLDNSSIQQDIISLNTDDQLYEKGIRADGTFIGEYSPATIEGIPGRFEGKKQKGQRYDHITLSDTGDFYKSFRFKNQKDEFIITADAIKEDTDLVREFGEEIIGLTDESLETVREWVRPLVQEKVGETLRA